MRDTVLVVDDDPDLRELVGIVLESMGVRVLAAENGQTALSLAEAASDRILLVLLDYFMPATDPATCARALRTRLDRCVPIVLCTAAVDPARRASELGLELWLSKPFSISALEDLVLRSGARGDDPWRTG